MAKSQVVIAKTPRLLRPETVPEFQAMFEHIYGAVNRKHYSDDHLVRRLMEEINVAMELARKDRRDAFAIQLPNIYSWYNAVANRYGIDLQEVLWKKYPGICSYCLRESNCVCGIEHPEISKEDKAILLRRLRREREGREPKTLREHQELHARLYRWQNERIMPIQVVAHLAEEAGELSRDLRHCKSGEADDDACGEMADIASWMFATATRLSLSPIDDLVWQRFSYECDLCHSDECQCKIVP
ncbi:MAG: hypothetical protein HYT93_03045 [Parcubacteria group bacterium]|nr:hypothetical protein [Parcubacteria group bacterium]